MQEADDIDPRELKREAQAIKERLLNSDSAEGMVGELALVHHLLGKLQAALEKVELQQRVFETALTTRDVLMSPEAAAAFKLPSQVTIEADHLINPEDGFYSLEHNDKGRPFRWTGPSAQFGFTFFVDRSAPLLLTASFLSALDPTVFPFVKVFADNRLVDTGYANEGGMHRIYAQLAARPVDTSRTAITFVMPAMQSPRQITPGSTDERLLGLAFAALSVAPGEPPAGLVLRGDAGRAIAGAERRGGEAKASGGARARTVAAEGAQDA